MLAVQVGSNRKIFSRTALGTSKSVNDPSGQKDVDTTLKQRQPLTSKQRCKNIENANRSDVDLKTSKQRH